MADGVEEIVEQNQQDPEMLKRALDLGYVDPEKWKGDPPPGGFLTAEEYIERGEQVLPIVKAENKRLKAQLEQAQAEGRSVAEQVRMLTASYNTLKDAMQQADQGNELARRKELMDELKDAIREDDADRQAEILEQLTAAPKQEAKREPAADPNRLDDAAIRQREREYAEFMASIDSWYDVDEDKTDVFEGICKRMRNKEKSALFGKAFLEEALRRTEEKMAGGEQRTGGKVGGTSRTTSGSTGGGEGGSGYSKLPADARKQCDADASGLKFPTPRYKDLAAFRASWAEQYNRA